MECAYKEIRKASFPVINALIQLLSFCYKPVSSRHWDSCHEQSLAIKNHVFS